MAQRTDMAAAPYALTQRELAERWRISPRTLERWRAKRTGPRFVSIGGRIIYIVSDVLAYEQANQVDTEASRPAAGPGTRRRSGGTT